MQEQTADHVEVVRLLDRLLGKLMPPVRYAVVSSTTEAEAIDIFWDLSKTDQIAALGRLKRLFTTNNVSGPLVTADRVSQIEHMLVHLTTEDDRRVFIDGIFYKFYHNIVGKRGYPLPDFTRVRDCNLTHMCIRIAGCY